MVNNLVVSYSDKVWNGTENGYKSNCHYDKSKIFALYNYTGNELKEMLKENGVKNLKGKKNDLMKRLLQV